MEVTEYFNKVSGGNLILKDCDEKNKGKGVFYEPLKTSTLPSSTLVLSSPCFGFLRYPQDSTPYCSECNYSTPEETEMENIFQLEDKPLLTCSGCKIRQYCSKQCQEISWHRYHKLECPLLKRDLFLKEPKELKVWLHQLRTYCLIKLCFKSKLDLKLYGKGETGVKGDITLTELGIKAFELHDGHSKTYFGSRLERTFRESSKLVGDQLTWILNNHNLLKDKEQLSNFTSQQLVSIQKVFACNNFTLESPQFEPVGTGYFPLASFFNHSCDPNCTQITHLSKINVELVDGVDGSGLIHLHSVTTLRPILPGEELTINYTDIIQNKVDRNKKLKSNYHFVCSCSRCQSSTEIGTGLIAKDPNFNSYEKLLPLSPLLDWLSITDRMFDQILGKESLVEKMDELYHSQLDTINISLPHLELKDKLFSRSFKVLSKLNSPLSVPQYESQDLELLDQTLISQLEIIHSKQLKDQFNINNDIVNDTKDQHNIPLPIIIGLDAFKLIHEERLPEVKEPNHKLNIEQLPPQFRYLCFNLTNQTFIESVLITNYSNVNHPYLLSKLLNLAKLWFNLGHELHYLISQTKSQSEKNLPHQLKLNLFSLYYCLLILKSFHPIKTFNNSGEILNISDENRLEWMYGDKDLCELITLMFSLIQTIENQLN